MISVSIVIFFQSYISVGVKCKCWAKTRLWYFLLLQIREENCMAFILLGIRIWNDINVLISNFKSLGTHWASKLAQCHAINSIWILIIINIATENKLLMNIQIVTVWGDMKDWSVHIVGVYYWYNLHHEVAGSRLRV